MTQFFQRKTSENPTLNKGNFRLRNPKDFRSLCLREMTFIYNIVNLHGEGTFYLQFFSVR